MLAEYSLLLRAYFRAPGTRFKSSIVGKLEAGVEEAVTLHPSLVTENKESTHALSCSVFFLQSANGATNSGQASLPQ